MLTMLSIFAMMHSAPMPNANTSYSPIPFSQRGGYEIQPVARKEVRLRDRFWLPRITRNHQVSLWHAIEQCEITGRIENFEAAAGVPGKKYTGSSFNDSDVYKVIEGVAYSLMYFPDKKLEAAADRIIGLIANAQEKDGYIQTALSSKKRGLESPMTERWEGEEWAHELYNVGHMYEGAVAYYEATGKRKFLDVAIKNADLVCATFNENGNLEVPGHQQIEMGLVRLYHQTGNPRYLQQARWFLDQRGKLKGRKHLYGEYSQDHRPVIEQDRAVGHSVRAAYMYSGMADVSAVQNLPAYDRTLKRVWSDVVGSKLYVTGGIGAAGSNEGFSGGFDLPNISAYAETCASIANAMWNQRMFQRFGEAQYIDVVERSLYNGFLSGVGLDGKSFFYPNPLTSLRGGTRSAWFDCSCCPTNDVRILPTVPQWIYAKSRDRLYVNLFAQSDLDTKLGDRRVRLRQTTDYPWAGSIKVEITPDRDSEFSLALRVPGWAKDTPVPSPLYRFTDTNEARPALKVNGKLVQVSEKNGYVVIDRTWKAGDKVEFDLPMPVRQVKADERVGSNVGRVAIQRGPLVYCAEGVDQPDKKVLNLMVPKDTKFVTKSMPELLGGVTVIDTVAAPVRRSSQGGFATDSPTSLRLVPYYAWANRERCEMTVWHAGVAESAFAAPAPTLVSQAKITTSAGWGDRELADQFEAKTSDDHTYPYFHWWPRRDSTEWVELALKEKATIKEVGVYWFHDAPHGGCRLPESWRVMVRKNGTWLPVSNARSVSGAPGYEVKEHSWCTVRFDATEADAVRIEVVQPKDHSTGIHEIVIR